MVGSKSKVKSFEIDKRLVHEAWMKVATASGGDRCGSWAPPSGLGGGVGEPPQVGEVVADGPELFGQGESAAEATLLATTHTTPQHARVAAAAFIESMHARAQAA